MEIGIAGAGIGGLAAAALLAQDGHRVRVYDRFTAPQPVGSGLVIQPVGLEVLDAVGAGQAARALGAPLAALHGDTAEGRIVLSVAYGATPARQGLGIHRAALFQLLLDAALAAGAELVPGHAVTGRDGPRLLFAGGGRSGRCNLIVDAAGAGSVLSPLRARPLPYGAIWATVPWPEATDLPADRLSQRYRRADRMLGVLPVGARPDRPDRRLAAVFYSMRVEDHPAWAEGSFADWRADALALWPAMAPFLHDRLGKSDFTFARYSHGSLRAPWGDGIAHIGDAAHRASPQLGQGANMALLDALALARALRQAHGEEALRLYAGARRWHVAAYQAMSAAFTPQYQSDSAVLPVLRDRVLAPLSRLGPVPAILTRLVCGDLLPPMPALSPRAVRGFPPALPPG
ncbi:FAD-dependent oxidoreductase [Roseicyclus persicicus]|uniref:FAD-dependent monooxygenase n=1 Tax=Roseicyclus persicicus TaxID=2650661 RepID=A0A7X6GXJ8_9RHOB|nr:FAD-dependent monooxygenase [Roseibacterium persicicum]NKX43373.1 FAD-dependent monooxygenase [Roseibacterium persicicum]